MEAASEIARQGLPAQWPDALALFWTEDGSAGFRVVPVNRSPVAGGGAQLGPVVCQLHMTTSISLSEVRAELARLIKKHDNAETEHLLITFGGPDRNGFRYPSEEAQADMLTSEVISSEEAKWLRRVTIHVWTSGAITTARLHVPASVR